MSGSLEKRKRLRPERADSEIEQKITVAATEREIWSKKRKIKIPDRDDRCRDRKKKTTTDTSTE